MSILRNAKLAIAAIRYLGSTILTRSRIPVRDAKHQLKHQLVSVNSPPSSNNYNNVSSVSCNSFQVFGKQNHRARTIFNGARRFYHRVVYYRADDQNLIQRAARNILIKVLGLGRNPCSKRIHFIHLSRYLERKIGELSFYNVKKTYIGKILPETHPKSARVRLIAEDIIEALRKGLRYEEVGDDLEFCVVDEPIVNACCMPGGKIVVFTGLLNVFRTDAEIATIVAHEGLTDFLLLSV
ncbi:hypothetical protein MKX01_041438 [Papaver californicum]|nr:hypothetical protein MKX01_041438 [Papaver californicum]